MAFRPALSAALLALFAAACQPAEKAAEPGPESAAVAPAATETASAEQGGGQLLTSPCRKAGYVPPATTSKLASLRVGQMACADLDVDLSRPTSGFVDADGKPHTFAEYQGKVLLYNIWAEWCGPCVTEMPSLARLQKAFAGKDVAVVPVAYGFGPNVTRESTLKKFRELVGQELPFFYDGEQMLQADAQTGALPATIIYDKSGKEVARLTVPAEWDSPESIALVQAVLDGQS